MGELVRVNTRISHTLNEWLDKESASTGMAKSTIVMLALENYYQQKEMLRRMSDMGEIMKKLEDIEHKIKD